MASHCPPEHGGQVNATTFGPARPCLIGYCWNQWAGKQGAQMQLPTTNCNYSPTEATGVGFFKEMGMSSRQLWRPPERLSSWKIILPVHGGYRADIASPAASLVPLRSSVLPLSFIGYSLKTSTKDFTWPQQATLLVAADKVRSAICSEIVSYCYSLNLLHYVPLIREKAHP